MNKFRQELIKTAMASLLGNTEIMKAVDKIKTADGEVFNLAGAVARLSIDCADEIIKQMNDERDED